METAAQITDLCNLLPAALQERRSYVQGSVHTQRNERALRLGGASLYQSIRSIGFSSAQRLVAALADTRTPPIIRQILAPTLPNRARVALANLLSNNGDHGAALGELRAVVRRAPAYPQARLMIGQIQAVIGDTDAAIETFEQALEIDPTSENAIESLVQLYSSASRSDEIIALLRNRSVALTESQWRGLGQGLWEASEHRRNSSIFIDVEDGCPSLENVEEDYREALAAGPKADDTTSREEGKLKARIAFLEEWAEKWALQVAGQNSVLGRQGAIMTSTDYHHSQGKMRVLALNLVRHKIKSYPARPNPPREIPEHLLSQFTMQGKVELAAGWYDSTLPEACSDHICDDHIRGFLACNQSALTDDARERANGILKDHPPGDDAMWRRIFDRRAPAGTKPALESLLATQLVDKNVAVVEEPEPYLESLCVASGCRVTSVRLRRVEGSPTLLKLAHLADWLHTTETYDVIICKRLIACWGLGRHGEPLDPDGDVALLAQLTRRLSPGGMIVTVLPLGRDRLLFNATRIYGLQRFPHLIGSDLVPIQPVEERKLAGRRARPTTIRLAVR